MTVQTRTLDTMPALLPLYRGAAAQAARDAVRRRERPHTLPAAPVVVTEHVIGEPALARWRDALGPVDPAALPSVLVHTQVFGAAMALMADPDFPLPLPGMVHLQNTVLHRLPVPAGVPLTVSAQAVGLVPHHAGTAVDMLVSVSAAEAPGAGALWEGVSRYLAKGVHLSAVRADRPEREPFTAPVRTAQWRFGSGAGREYAAVSGDWNPIHLSAASARAFGQRRAIAHGMLLAARMLAGREPAEAGMRWDIAFEAPVTLPGTVSVAYAPTGDGGAQVTGWDARRGRRHFHGSYGPLTA